MVRHVHSEAARDGGGAPVVPSHDHRRLRAPAVPVRRAALGGDMKMTVTHRFDADVDTVYRLMTDQDFMARKYADQGATDIEVDSDGRDDGPTIVTRRKVT